MCDVFQIKTKVDQKIKPALARQIEALEKIRPDLIWCSISGYGRQSPLADRAGYDYVVIPSGSCGGQIKHHYLELLRDDPDYLAIARQVQQLDLYRQAAEPLGIAVPSEMRSSQLLDGQIWDGNDPAGYARSFALHALVDAPIGAQQESR